MHVRLCMLDLALIIVVSCMGWMQAEKLRQQMLHRLHQVLTARQMARSLLAVSDYFHRLRVLSSFWVNRNRMAPQDQQLEAGPHT